MGAVCEAHCVVRCNGRCGVALHAAWQSVYERFPIGWEQFQESMQGWEVHPVMVGGRVAGAVLVNGPEIHACILPFAHRIWVGRKELRLLNKVIEKHGFAQTHATTKAGEEFVHRLGFVRHGKCFRRNEKWALRHS